MNQDGKAPPDAPAFMLGGTILGVLICREGHHSELSASMSPRDRCKRKDQLLRWVGAAGVAPLQPTLSRRFTSLLSDAQGLTRPAQAGRVTTRAKGQTMRASLRHILTTIAVLLGLWSAGCFCALQGQEVACPEYFDCGFDSVWSNGRTIGYSTNAYDLNLDGKVDFRFIHCVFGGDNGQQLPYIICNWRDETQALFAEPHVQMYLSKQEADCLALPPEARLVTQQLIPAQPPADSTWHWIQPTNVARLKGIGFGWTLRILRYGEPSGNTIPLEPGYIQRNTILQTTNALFGFRIQQPDGWHLGWLKLIFFYSPTGGEVLQIAESSVNPVPDQDVFAGVKMGTFLDVGMKGTNSLQLSWSTNATNMVLEQKLRLTDPAWTVVAGVTNNLYAVSPTNPASFFRLKGQ